jgi:hypothetical protein
VHGRGVVALQEVFAAECVFRRILIACSDPS